MLAALLLRAKSGQVLNQPIHREVEMATTVDPGISTNTTEGTFVPPVPLYSAVLLIITIVVGLAGNTMTIFIYIKAKALRNPTNVFIINLAVADNGVMLCVVPIVHTMLGTGGAQFYGSAGCFWHAFLIITCCTTSLVTMGCIAFTRYIAIVHPQKKSTLMRWKYTIPFSILLWAYAILLMAPAIAGWGRLGWLPKQFHCSYDWSDNMIYNGIVFIFAYGLVSVTIFFCYFWIYKVFKESRNRVSQGANKERKDGVKKQKDEIRLAIQLLVVYVIYNVCWFPFFLFSLFVDPAALLPVELYGFTIVSIFSNSAVNFLVYMYFNRVFREEVYKFICCGKKLKEKTEDTSKTTVTTVAK